GPVRRGRPAGWPGSPAGGGAGRPAGRLRRADRRELAHADGHAAGIRDQVRFALGRLTAPNERRRHWYQWHMSAGASETHPVAPMDELPVSEILPGLYRAVLDSVANLEARSRRSEAATIRAEATRVYSRAWTPDAARRLRALRAK